MKILHLYGFPLYGTGGGTYVRNLATVTSELGHEVAICCPDKRRVPNVRIYHIDLPFQAVYFEHPEYPESTQFYKLNGCKFFELHAEYQKSILQVIEKFKPQLIHVHHAGHLTWIAQYIKDFYGVPYLVTCHNSAILHARDDARFVPFTSAALNEAKYVTVPSNFTKQHLLSTYEKFCTLRSLKKKTFVIPGGVNTDKFRQKLQISLDAKYSLKNKKLILFSGRITPSGEIIIVGDGKARKNLESYVERHNIHNVKFRGHINKKHFSELIAFYQRADVLIFPSTEKEAFGLVLLEAMAANTAVVASDCGGVPDIVKNNKTGLLIKPRSMTEIRDKVNFLLENDVFRQKLATQAYAFVKKTFDWKSITNTFVLIYEKMI